MKQQLHETTLRLLSILKVEYTLTQKKIAEGCGISPVDISKAKNPQESSWNEVSIERWQSINEKLEDLIAQYAPSSTEDFLPPDFARGLRYSSAVFGMLAGIISCFVTVLFRNYLGFQQMSLQAFYWVTPILFVIHTLIGAAIGFCAAYATTEYWQGRGTQRGWLLFVFVSVFILATLLRGMTARDATLIAAIINWEAAGPLGEPNFELLATSLALALCALLLTRALLEKQYYTFRDLLFRAIWFSLCSAFSYVLVYAIFLLLIQFEWINLKAYWWSPAVFEYSFSHPERLPWVWLFLFTVLLGIWYNANDLLLKAKDRHPET